MLQILKCPLPSLPFSQSAMKFTLFSLLFFPFFFSYMLNIASFNLFQTLKARVGTISPEGGEAAPTLPRSDSPSVQSHPDTFIQEISQPVISRRISSSREPNRLLGLDQAVHYSIDSCGMCVNRVLYIQWWLSPNHPLRNS